MNARDAIKMSIDSGAMVSDMYLADLTDQELFHRPCAGINHINWQVGHLVVAEHDLIEMASPGSMPALPAGFKEKYAKGTAGSDDPKQFCTKDELMAAYKAQRAGTLAALAKMSESDLDKPSGMDFAPTVASLFDLQGGHWLMHAGQWAVIRRQLGRAPLF